MEQFRKETERAAQEKQAAFERRMVEKRKAEIDANAGAQKMQMMQIHGGVLIWFYALLMGLRCTGWQSVLSWCVLVLVSIGLFVLLQPEILAMLVKKALQPVLCPFTPKRRYPPLRRRPLDQTARRGLPTPPGKNPRQMHFLVEEAARKAGRQEAGRQEAGRQEAGRQEAGRQEAGRQEAGRQAGRQEAGRQENGGEEAGGREEAGRAGREEAGQEPDEKIRTRKIRRARRTKSLDQNKCHQP